MSSEVVLELSLSSTCHIEDNGKSVRTRTEWKLVNFIERQITCRREKQIQYSVSRCYRTCKHRTCTCHSQGAAGPPSNEQVAKSIGPLGEKQSIVIGVENGSSKHCSFSSGTHAHTKKKKRWTGCHVFAPYICIHCVFYISNKWIYSCIQSILTFFFFCALESKSCRWHLVCFSGSSLASEPLVSTWLACFQIKHVWDHNDHSGNKNPQCNRGYAYINITATRDTHVPH